MLTHKTTHFRKTFQDDPSNRCTMGIEHRRAIESKLKIMFGSNRPKNLKKHFFFKKE